MKGSKYGTCVIFVLHAGRSKLRAGATRACEVTKKTDGGLSRVKPNQVALIMTSCASLSVIHDILNNASYQRAEARFEFHWQINQIKTGSKVEDDGRFAFALSWASKLRWKHSCGLAHKYLLRCVSSIILITPICQIRYDMMVYPTFHFRPVLSIRNFHR